MLDGLGFETRQGQETLLFSEISGWVRGPIQHPLTLVLGFLPGGKVAGS